MLKQLLWIASLCFCAAGLAAELIEPLKPLSAIVGKTWRGEFSNSTPEKPIVDVSRWETALQGQAVRIRHSINDGEYGGESFVVWDKEKASIVYYYFTTAGFYTHGTMKIDGDKLVSSEEVTGNENGITQVRSTSSIGSDAVMRGKTEYLQNGKWVPGHSVEYREAPDAQVIIEKTP